MLQIPVLATQDHAQERRHVLTLPFGRDQARFTGTLGPEKGKPPSITIPSGKEQCPTLTVRVVDSYTLQQVRRGMACSLLMDNN